MTRSWRPRKLSWLYLSALLCSTRLADASQAVVVTAASADLEPLIGRICAELAVAGYAVNFQISEPPPACERALPTESKTAWVGLAADSSAPQYVLATVCFDGTIVLVRGAHSETARFAVSTAEALNGLRATGPAHERSPSPPPVARTNTQSTASSNPAKVRPLHAFALSQTLLVDPGGFPPLWGTSLDLYLAVGAYSSIAVGGFVPLSRAELSGEHANLEAALTFLRMGPVMRYPLGSFVMEGALLGGATFTWVNGEAVPPYIAGTDSAFGFVGTAALSVAYPGRGPVFTTAGAKLDLLLPAPSFALPSEAARDLGPLLVEANVGLGLRF